MWSAHCFRILARASTPKTGRSRRPAPSPLTYLAKPLPCDTRWGSTSSLSAMHRNNITQKPMWHEKVRQGLAIGSRVPDVLRDVNKTFNHREKSRDVVKRRYEQLESATSERTDEHRNATRIFSSLELSFPSSSSFAKIKYLKKQNGVKCMKKYWFFKYSVKVGQFF